MEIEKDALTTILGALGARADKVPELERQVEMYRKWWHEEESKVSKLREQLRDAGIDPVA